MNIALVGMMGSGKTTIGKLLVEKLKCFSFVDTDELIIKSQNMQICDIFDKFGENYFRKKEEEVLYSILQYDNNIISTGGGIVLSKINLNLLKQKTLMIYLSADAHTLYLRVKNDNSRPLLQSGNAEEKISNLLMQRKPLYEQAHFTIDTTNKSTDIIVNEIVNVVKL